MNLLFGVNKLYVSGNQRAESDAAWQRKHFKKYPQDIDVFAQLIQLEQQTSNSSVFSDRIAHPIGQALVQQGRVASLVRYLKHVDSWLPLVLLSQILPLAQKPRIPQEHLGRFNEIRTHYLDAAAQKFPMHFKHMVELKGQYALMALQKTLSGFTSIT
jgi:hypothetical protein